MNFNSLSFKTMNMKKSILLIILISFIGISAFAQTDATTVTGTITSPNAFNDQCGLTVGNTFLVLVKDHADASGKSFEINSEYKDLLIVKDGKYEVAPKYAGKTFKITYYVNGKGWKCIKTIELVK